MEIRLSFRILILFITIASSVSCGKKSEVDPQLTVTPATVSFPGEGGTSKFALTCNDKWSISNSASSWLQLNKTTGTSGSDSIQITTTINNSGSSRSTILVINSTNGQSRRISVSQLASLFPSYNTSPKAPDATGMGSNAVELAAKINLGWNIGNTLEGIGGEKGWEGNKEGWNPMITESYVKAVKQLGFNAIRLPCAWNWYHIDNKQTAHIDENWINRVKEVVGYCVNNDMYVMLNVHWDGGWLENNCTKEKQDSVNAKQKAIWEQIATAMRDFDEHLMFASANEPNAGDATQMGVLLTYHQTFVNAVRSTGGRNTYRILVIQGSSDFLQVKDFPSDPTPNRMMYEEHNYSPSQFTILKKDVDWGKVAFYWGEGHHSTIEPDRNATYGEESDQLKYFQRIKEQFIDKGIPVLMGEYGAYRKLDPEQSLVPKDLETHNASIDYWLTYITKQAIAHGVKPFYWDTGGALDRGNNTVKDQRTIDAIMAGAQK